MTTFDSVWDALEKDPIKAKNMKIRSELMMAISKRVDGMTQTEAAGLLGVSQPRVNALLKGKIDQFRLDSLVDMAHRIKLKVSVDVAA